MPSSAQELNQTVRDLGVTIGPTPADIESVPENRRSEYILQERISFEPVIETPFGPTKAEIRIMYVWVDELRAVTTIVRMGRGKMMGVDHDRDLRDLEWVGASAASWYSKRFKNRNSGGIRTYCRALRSTCFCPTP